jgi:hypothetical protein
MTTISLRLDEELDAALGALCAAKPAALLA